ncbi:MAG: response regulator transcription factor [Bacillota bacterium]|nr:response regulator transcription factor [Bacillota bacterium]
MRILLVEDEFDLSEALEYVLKKNKFLVDVAADGISGQDMAETGIYDLIILDRMLPGKEGVQILRELRAAGYKCPVIFITAKDAVSCRVEGLDAGADDYLIKPFSMDELLARVRALARRSENRLQGDSINIASLTLNPLRGEVSYGNAVVRLTVKEAQLMELLMRNFGQVLTKEQIFERVWGYDSDVDFSCIELYIHYLRKKIDLPECGLSIETVRGIGYSLAEVGHV